MKGMQRIKRHKNFINVVKYVLKSASHHREAPSIIGGNMTGDCAKELIAEFDTASKLRKDIAKPAWHNSLRLPRNDKLTNEQWKLIADDYMTQLGFSDTHLRCYVLHDDSAGQHIHIIANRIDSVSSKVHLGRHESLKSGRIIQELEIKYGLTITKGPEPLKSTATGKETKKAKKISRNEVMYEERTGEICNKKQLQSILDRSLADSPDVETFLLRLEDAKISWTANIATTGRMNGLSFVFNGIAFKASQLGKTYSWNNLQKKLNYQPERDNNLFIKNESIPASETKTVIEEKAEKQFVPKDIQTIAEKISALEAEIRKNRFPPVAEESDYRQSKTQNWLPFVKHIALLFKNYGSSLLHSHFRFHQILAVIPLRKNLIISKKLKH
ncbi:relaxase/mobilization nuclease domain-containing protein [Klebsiella pneumoniae]|uniref:relaxase/mobilization nuclease domain-containing protein n=1 Tax=Klebsiella pneumoniae TaxID=573 RepID=UPI00081326E7|nr:relaxase/mobilization nuclease domain-containing protein [Klebsiella pneumoniae]MBS2929000.1 relaxase/mobilization nuclease domain-containing protein [Klebsiella pneumoniae]MCM6358344.1 relaxase/mobilization nuclease domain-containing protein [Klebsiella pneumoniae]HBR7473777.1 relaxase/mobilization nuclease domain-containing protein [Klebsiella pneumoniae]HCK7352232.1 relaxase/mobilization nuclease domain-containing protein [Klebsiella pneumoniae]HCK7369551.1 relaxase/mobilization nuclease